MNEVVIVDAVRTPIGRLGGALAEVRPDDLGAHAIRALVQRTGVDPAAIEDVYFGCANQAGEDNRNVARMSASGLDAVQQAGRAVLAGDGAFFVAGGVESMSRAPLSIARTARGNVTAWDTSLGWRYPNPAIEALFPLESMGETAENIQAETNISRERQDAFALRSHRRAVAAHEAGRFSAELVPVDVPGRKGAVTRVDRDEGPRADTSLESLAALRPVFRPGGSVTAGNASSQNDGAAAVLVAERGAAESAGMRPLARLVASAVAGVDPRTRGYGPVPASRKALDRAGLTVADLDLVELNEAFAVQALAVIDALGLDEDKVNVNGGGIAIGHPLGCSGARLVATLLHELRARGGRYGLATLCVGVGQGVACIFENLRS
jgi:acetyl-CoA acetyltransferase family protein